MDRQQHIKLALTEDQYKKDYERKGKIYTLLDTIQILISKIFLSY